MPIPILKLLRGASDPTHVGGGREAVDYSVKIGEEHQLFSAPDYFATEAIVTLQGACPFRIVLALPLIPCGF